MVLFDLPLPELRTYRPDVPLPADFGEFWAGTLGEARRHDVLVSVEPVATGPRLVRTWDVTFAGFAVAGNSQGGGLAIVAAGLDDRVSALLPSVPFLCDIQRNIDITDAKPYGEIVQHLAAHRNSAGRVLTRLSYFDGVHFAARTAAPALFATALRDTVCPPSGVFAAFNALRTQDKETEVYPFNSHEGGEAVHTERQVDWLAERSGKAER